MQHLEIKKISEMIGCSQADVSRIIEWDLLDKKPVKQDIEKLKEELFAPSAAASYLDYSRGHVHRLASESGLEYIRIKQRGGWSRRFFKKHLDRFKVVDDNVEATNDVINAWMLYYKKKFGRIVRVSTKMGQLRHFIKIRKMLEDIRPVNDKDEKARWPLLLDVAFYYFRVIGDKILNDFHHAPSYWQMNSWTWMDMFVMWIDDSYVGGYWSWDDVNPEEDVVRILKEGEELSRRRQAEAKKEGYNRYIDKFLVKDDDVSATDILREKEKALMRKRRLERDILTGTDPDTCLPDDLTYREIFRLRGFTQADLEIEDWGLESINLDDVADPPPMIGRDDIVDNEE